jgi:site-specific recombinase XerD
MWIEGFLRDCRVKELSPFTIQYYRAELATFEKFARAQNVTQVPEITPDLLREYLLELEATGHNPGGRHAKYRAVRAFLLWWKEETEPAHWTNPVAKVKAPKVALEPIEGASTEDVKALLATCGDDFTGARDKAIMLGLLLGAGLRREELAALKFDAIKTQPTKKGARVVLEVTGKGAKDRVIPVNAILAAKLYEWRQLAGSEHIARAMVRKSKTQLADSMSAVAIFHLVNKYGKQIGKPGLAPHDLRRTYAQPGYNAGVPITQISVLLGHSSVKTTQEYSNLNLDLESTASDFVPLAG